MMPTEAPDPERHPFLSSKDNIGTMCDWCYGSIDCWTHWGFDAVPYSRPPAECPVCGHHAYINMRNARMALHFRGKDKVGSYCPGVGRTIEQATMNLLTGVW
jgi:hypothetical protein